MPPHVAFVFLDGVGLGPGGPTNPLDSDDLPAFARLAGRQRWTDAALAVDTPTHVFRPIDATLGMDGLPQSGTGQTTLFAGFNAPQLAGRHWGPYPHSATVDALAAHNLWQRLLDAGVPISDLAFLNAYPPVFFAHAEAKNRWTTTTRMTRSAGLPLFGVDDVIAGRALTAELTGQAWRDRLGLGIPTLTPFVAGQRLHALARERRVVLFEYYLTDKAGHARDAEQAAAILRDLDGFFEGYLDGFDPERDLLVVSSDHGNLEALDRKPHTTNPVPLVALGRRADAFRRAATLADVTPALVEAALG